MGPEPSFRIGMIYGPSGSGKSSFLKAGVIPQLSDSVQTVYVESTPLETETRLLSALRRAFPDLSPDAGLAAGLACVRRGLVAAPRKVLLVLDQFEQWLHARRGDSARELTEALRQCDGIHVQCIVAVRDEFWMAVTHFLDELEVAPVPGENVASIDLWSPRHARLVLTAIGQAYRELPANRGEITVEQKLFIKSAIADLTHNDRIVPVQLALFAEMVKDRLWVLATLKSLGGARGVGETFLEETFNGPSASPGHRLHQKAARAVLGALLADQHGSLKGSMRSYQELLDASGYSQRPKEFESLLRVLNSELRLITPTDPEGLDLAGGPRARGRLQPPERYFHLTHDYLRPLVACLGANPQAKGDPAGTGGVAPGGACRGLGTPPDRPKPAVVARVVKHSPPRAAEHAREHPGEQRCSEGGRPVLRPPDSQHGHIGRPAPVGGIRLERGKPGRDVRAFAGDSPDRRRPGAGPEDRTGPPLGRPAPAEDVRRRRPRLARTPARRPGVVTCRRPSCGRAVDATHPGRARRLCGDLRGFAGRH